MRKIFLNILVPFFSLGQSAFGQSFSEWFKQGSTQKKYLAQQIAAFEAYRGVLEKGYEIARFGLNTIWDIRSGEFGLHRDFFNRLLSTSPKIQGYARIADILKIESNILKIQGDCLRQTGQYGLLSEDEQEYIKRVFDRLLEDCARATEQLISLTAPSGLSMSDSERLERIEAIYRQMRDNWMFASYFSGESGLLASARQREQQSDERIKKLYQNDENK